jgi:hydroxyethylthiazole kinase
MNTSSLPELLIRVRDRRPLVHHITNYVTVNDCANITLSIGGAPVMAEAREEVEEMAGMADALVLNIGTLSTTQVESMVLAGCVANARGIPIVLDPVGAGATRLRTETVLHLLKVLKIAVLKGNAVEIGTIAGCDARVRGVDSVGLSGDPAVVTSELARRLDCVVAMSGQVDTVSDGIRIVRIENGHPLMGRLSGTGCMAASVIGSFAAANDDRFEAAVGALVSLGLAGERAGSKAKGPASFRFKLLDALASLEPADLENSARIG